MLGFNLLDLGDNKIRCVFGGDLYCDCTPAQFEMFGYEHCYGIMSRFEGTPVYSIYDNREEGDVVSVKYVREEDSIWVLIRHGIHGEFYVKELGG